MRARPPAARARPAESAACVHAGALAFGVGVLRMVAQGADASACGQMGAYNAALAVLFLSLRDVIGAALVVGKASATALAAGLCGSMFGGRYFRTVFQAMGVAGVCCAMAERLVTVLDGGEAGKPKRRRIESERSYFVSMDASWFKSTVWRSTVRNIDEEYEDLVRLHEKTSRALANEQAYIALLLEKLAEVKGRSRRQGRDQPIACTRDTKVFEEGDNESKQV